MSDTPTSILLIDDDAILRQGLAVYLSDSGFVVFEAADGPTGLALCHQERPDLILCDLRMPGMDGLEVVGTIVVAYPELPVIVLTGQGVLQDAIAALRRGAWDFLTKPILDYDVLEWSIARALERARLMQENRRYREDLEREVAAKTEEYRASEARLSAVINSLHEAFVLVFALDGKIVQALGTRELETRLGVAREDLYNDRFVAMFPIESNDWHLDAVRRVAASGEVQVGVTTATFPSGNVLLECTYTPMYGADGTVANVLGFARDITRQRAAEREARRLEAQMRQAQKMEALGTLAGGIAHDFNNMLSVILGFSDLALRNAHGHATESPLREIQTAGQRAAELVRQILTFSRRAEMQRAPVEFAPVVKEALRLLRASLPSNIEIQQELVPVGSVLGDLTQFHQLLLNLGGNAYHAMRQQERGTLRVSLRPAAAALVQSLGLTEGDYLHLRVADTGHGIPAEAIEHIFEPFYTTKGVGEGTGMGLAIVHGIVTQAGGAARASNAPEGGAVFDIVLPRLIVTQDTSPVPQAPPPRGTGRLVLVDDEPACARLWKRWLEGVGYTVHAFTDSGEALAFVQDCDGRLDLLLTDFLMPRLTGLGLAREVHAQFPRIPILLLSGAADLPDEEHVYSEAGIRERLNKPIDAPILAQAVARVLQKQ